MKTKSFNILSLVIVLLTIIVLISSVWAFGFEKNIQHRKSADVGSVEGCMQSCEDMLAGWLEMNPNSKNYDTQKEKIETKAKQCLSMNELAGFPYSEEEIIQSCGMESEPECVEVFEEDIFYGACTDISSIGELNLPQCCGIEGPLHGIDCGADEEWVVGITAVPVCYISNS